MNTASQHPQSRDQLIKMKGTERVRRNPCWTAQEYIDSPYWPAVLTCDLYKASPSSPRQCACPDGHRDENVKRETRPETMHQMSSLSRNGATSSCFPYLPLARRSVFQRHKTEREGRLPRGLKGLCVVAARLRKYALTCQLRTNNTIDQLSSSAKYLALLVT